MDLSSSTAKIGQPDPAALVYLNRRSLVPLRTLLARTTNPHLDDPDAIRVFYAQSWALTHLLMLGQDDAATGRQALARYMTLVGQGTDPVAAFEQEVGNIEEFDRRLQEYRRQFSFLELRMETGDDIDDDTFVTRELSQTEALALRANVLTEGADPDAAGPLLEEAEAFGENSAVLAEANGLFHLHLGRQEEADRWFAEAIELGSTSYIPYYLQARAAEDTATRIERLRQATAYNPRYAPAYAELARLYANDSVFDEAMPLASRAVELNKGEAFYWILLGQIFLHMDQPDAARVVAQRGLDSAPDPEAQKDLTAFVGEVDEYMAARAERERRAARQADRVITNRGTEAPESVPPPAPPVDTAQEVLDPLGGDEPESPESAQRLQRGETRQVTGTWSALECPPGGGLNFVVQAAGVTYILHANTPEPVEIRDADGAIQEEIFCGPQGRQVIVGFAPSGPSDGSGPVRGTLTELRFP